MLAILLLVLTTSPPPSVVRLGAVAELSAEEGVLTATPCAEAPTCSGEVVRVPTGTVALRLWRAGQHDVIGRVAVTASARVRAAPTPDTTIAAAVATTGVALGLSLIATSALILGLDAEHDSALRVARPLATGLGGAALVGGALWLRALPEPRRDVTLELVF